MVQTLSPMADRVGAALKALRLAQDTERADKLALGAKSLRVLIVQLIEEGVS